MGYKTLNRESESGAICVIFSSDFRIYLHFYLEVSYGGPYNVFGFSHITLI